MVIFHSYVSLPEGKPSIHLVSWRFCFTNIRWLCLKMGPMHPQMVFHGEKDENPVDSGVAMSSLFLGKPISRTCSYLVHLGWFWYNTISEEHLLKHCLRAARVSYSVWYGMVQDCIYPCPVVYRICPSFQENQFISQTALANSEIIK